ncbi:S-type anion channel SLAH2-like isoform X2 [Phragmites australis]|nr:S-type anion channel SLAH2-like isoform X2 [Phragmites australis]XP_062215668.1 S-type anion channel SLAH2-like isoform X2 [Phragmites australis]XP_062215676.1 S-type anion channel SLAH2-like isoform X2 [Phragmites australis]XP_062215684.1 S-type anion channel SLAH2-like isoform X2 [Phragmites australis]
MEFSSKDVQMPGLQSKQSSKEALPALLIQVPSQTIAGFDCVGADATVSLNELDKEGQQGSGTTGNKDIVISIPAAPASAPRAAAPGHAYDDAQIPYSISLSMPSSPSGFHLSQFRESAVRRDESRVAPTVAGTGFDVHQAEQQQVEVPSPQLLKQTRFHSQPILHTSKNVDEARRCDNTRDKRFDPFKTFSGRLERQLSNLRGRPQEPIDAASPESKISEEETDQVPAADRYFDALEGPELDTLRATEVPVLPKDEKWPFLLRFPISAFGMCLGVSSQAILWKTLALAPPTAFLHVSPVVNHVLWYVALALMVLVSSIYLLKVVFYFEAVRREFYHPVRANFFFAPWIACLFLVLGAPRLVAEMHHGVWYALMAPIFCLELKIYGQWMSGGQQRLSKVANPSNHLSIVGNFVGALLGAKMGLREGPIFFFAVGLAHYMVLFVTLYQRLPTNVTLPKELHPVFFLFVAAPSVASMAWAKINGNFDTGARIAYFIALFLYMSLAVRINFFRGFRFSLAWWAYTFPMTGASIATITYAAEVTNMLTRALSIGLSGISTVTVAGLLVTTVFHAFVLRDLFPNDVSIAITRRKPKFSKILAHFRSSSTDMKELVLSFSKPSQSDSGETDRSVTGVREEP